VQNGADSTRKKKKTTNTTKPPSFSQMSCAAVKRSCDIDGPDWPQGLVGQAFDPAAMAKRCRVFMNPERSFLLLLVIVVVVACFAWLSRCVRVQAQTVWLLVVVC
jgi:hypothetical protein